MLGVLPLPPLLTVETHQGGWRTDLNLAGPRTPPFSMERKAYDFVLFSAQWGSMEQSIQISMLNCRPHLLLLPFPSL